MFDPLQSQGQLPNDDDILKKLGGGQSAPTTTTTTKPQSSTLPSDDDILKSLTDDEVLKRLNSVAPAPVINVGAPDRQVGPPMTPEQLAASEPWRKSNGDSFDVRKYLPRSKQTPTATQPTSQAQPQPQAPNTNQSLIDTLNNQSLTNGPTVSSITNKPVQSLVERLGGRQKFDAANAHFAQQRQIRDNAFQLALHATPEKRDEALRNLAKLGPISTNEQHQLGVDSHYLQSFLRPLWAQSEEMLGGVARMAAAGGNPYAKSIYQHLNDAAVEDRLQANLHGERGYTGDILQTAGEIVPQAAGASLAPEGLAADLAFPATGMLSSAGRGEDAEHIIKSGLANFVPIAGAKVFAGAGIVRRGLGQAATNSLAKGAVEFGSRAAPNIVLNNVVGGMAGVNDEHGIFTNTLMSIVMSKHGNGDFKNAPESKPSLNSKGQVSESTPESIKATQALNNDDLQQAIAQHFAQPSAESITKIKAVATRIGLPPRDIWNIIDAANKFKDSLSTQGSAGSNEAEVAAQTGLGAAGQPVSPTTRAPGSTAGQELQQGESVPATIAPFSERFPIGSQVSSEEPGSFTGEHRKSGVVIGHKVDPVTGETFAEIQDTNGRTHFAGDINDIKLEGGSENVTQQVGQQTVNRGEHQGRESGGQTTASGSGDSTVGSAQGSGETAPTVQVGQPLTHSDPDLHGRPIVATTDDGRAVVQNDGNKGGVSVVKDQTPSTTPPPEPPSTAQSTTPPREEFITGIKNAQVEAERNARNMPQIEKEGAKSFGESWQNAHDAIENGYPIRRLTKEWSEKPRPLTDEEHAALEHDRVTLYNEHLDRLNDMEDALKSKDPIRVVEAKANLLSTESDIATNDLAATKTGTQSGRAFGIRRMMADQDYTISKMVQRYNIANNGEGVPDDIRSQLSQLTKERDAAVKALDDHLEAQKTKGLDDMIKDVQKKETFKTKKSDRAARKLSLDQEFEEQKVNFLNALKGEGSKALKGKYSSERGAASTEPIIPKEAINVLKEMARNRVQSGIATVEGLVDAMYDFAKDHIDGLTKSAMRIALSGHGETSTLSQDPLDVQMRDLSRQMHLIERYEEAMRGEQPQGRGFTGRDTLSDEAIDLQNQVKKAMKDNGLLIPKSDEAQLATATKTRKSQLRTEIDKLDQEIAGHEQRVNKPERTYDDETIALAAERDMLKRQLEDPTAQNKADVKIKLEEAERKLREKDIAKAEGPEYPATIYDDAETTDLRAKLKETNRQIVEARALPDKIAGLESKKADLERRLREGDLSKPESQSKEGRPQSPDVVKLKGDIKDLDKQLSAARAEQKEAQRLEDRKADLARRIREKDFSPRPSPEARKVSDRIKQLRAERDALQQQYNDVKPPPIPNEAALLKATKTRLTKRQAELDKMKASGQFYTNPITGKETLSKPRTPIALDKEALDLKAKVGQTTEELNKIIKQREYQNRDSLTKTLDTIAAARRFQVLGRPSTLLKLAAAASWRMITSPIEEVIGAGLGKLPIIRKVAGDAPRQGGFSFKAEAEALRQIWDKGSRADIRQALKTGETSLDFAYGHSMGLPPELLGMMGRVHAAFKVIPKRAEFFRSFQKRAEAAAKSGLDIGDPTVQATIGAQAYLDANRAIFLQDNFVNNSYTQAIHAMERSGDIGKIGATTAKVLMPIVKVPTNYIGEGIGEYGLGGVKGGLRILYTGLKNLTPEQRDTVMRAFKKQGLGAAMLTVGYFAPKALGVNAGGYYQQGEKRKSGAPNANEVSVGGVNIPHLVLHSPPIEAMQFGATLRNVEDAGKKASGYGSNMTHAQKSNTLGVAPALGGALTQVPFLQEPARVKDAFTSDATGSAALGDFAKTTLIPPMLSELAEQLDRTKGKLNKRQPKGFGQAIESGIPYVRTHSKIPLKKK